MNINNKFIVITFFLYCKMYIYLWIISVSSSFYSLDFILQSTMTESCQEPVARTLGIKNGDA